MSKSIIEELSEERKYLQEIGELPDWYTTPGWQLFKEKYVYKGQHVKEAYHRIAKAAAFHMPNESLEWEQKFFDVMWKGWLAPSTPVMANMGTDRGCPVSCSGGYIDDSIYSFYSSQLEAAMLSKNGFGTSGYLGDIRPRGDKISTGGFASGVVPVLKDFIQLSRDVSQGSNRRGAWAGYLEIDHDDFWEVITYLEKHPDDCNIGWNISDEFIARLDDQDEDAINRYQKTLKIKMITGKGYYFFTDRVNEQNPQCYKDKDFKVLASNLCTEITLMSDLYHTFTCVLSSMNLDMYDEWKYTDAVYISTVFLDCVASEFIRIGSEIKGLKKAVRFTEKSRALGLGTLGFHSYLQKNNIAFESLEANYKNSEIFKHLHDESLRASKWMAEALGEPEWCEGYGVRNSHRTSIAPNLSSALLCGSKSQGIEPTYQNAYVQSSAGGEINRVNPYIIEIMKRENVYNNDTIEDIINNKGSVQHVVWLTEDEKMVFKTAFEIDQSVIIRMADVRQKYICQAQSINLFFDSNEKEEYISHIHQLAFKSKNIKSLYYIRSLAGVQAAKGECVACEG